MTDATNITRRDTPRHLGTELMQDLADKIAELAQSMLGVPESKAKAFATEVAGAIADDWGGQNIYIPMEMVGRLSERNLKMYREFTGDNQPELAARYSLSVQQVYVILKVQRQLHMPKQLSLLDTASA